MTGQAHKAWLQQLRLAGSLILVAAAAVLLLWGFWPTPRTVLVLWLDSSQTAPEPVQAGAVHAVRALRLEFPARIRLNDRALVRLAFEVEPEGAGRPPNEDVADSSTANGIHPIAEARLEVPGALVRPPDSIHEALVPGRTLEFFWTVVLSEPGEYRGTAWSFLTIQDDSSLRPSRIALAAQNVEMRSMALLGMGGEAARIAGGLSLIGGLVLALPFVEPAARWLARRGARGV